MQRKKRIIFQSAFSTCWGNEMFSDRILNRRGVVVILWGLMVLEWEPDMKIDKRGEGEG
jgi:hypothetical protein